MTALLHPCIGFISQVRCINPLFALKSRCQLCCRRRRRGLSYRQLPAASAVKGLVARYLAVSNVVSRFYHWCYCYFYHCPTCFMLCCSCWLSNDACYIPWFYQLHVFYAKCLVRNEEIKLWNHIQIIDELYMRYSICAIDIHHIMIKYNTKFHTCLLLVYFDDFFTDKNICHYIYNIYPMMCL